MALNLRVFLNAGWYTNRLTSFIILKETEICISKGIQATSKQILFLTSKIWVSCRKAKPKSPRTFQPPSAEECWWVFVLFI